MIYYTIDIETNGTKVNYHEITEISIVRIEDLVQFSRFIKIKYPKKTNPEALKATGRSYKDLYKGYPVKDVIDEVNNFFAEDGKTPEHRCIVGHNILMFDRKFLNATWQEHNLEFPAVCWLDTKQLIKKYAQNYLGIAKPKVNLADSLKIMEIKARGTAHSAVPDTQNTTILYKKLEKTGMDILPFIKRIANEENKEQEENDE